MSITREQLTCVITREVECEVLSDEDIITVITKTLCGSNVTFESDATVSVTVTYVSDDKIQLLNSTYRGKNTATDVLSFPDAFVDKTAPGVDGIDGDLRAKGDLFLGDIILSCATIERYATMDNVDIKCAHIFVLSHGVLHTLGYDHSTMMFDIQDAIIAQHT